MGEAGGRRDLDALIQRIATGPKLSKDLTRDEARAGMAAVLEGLAHPVQAGIFLIALRMKRESDDEVLGLLDAISEASRHATADVPELVDVSEPYDGFSRQLPVTAFLPCVLAACGAPAVSHGVECMGPKRGLTHARVLEAAGVSTSLGPDAAAGRIADPRVGWAYLDQSSYCPALHALVELRRLMVKRTALSTVERVACTLRGRRRTHLLAGYVHVAYPPVYARLARAAGFDSALLVRGSEGAVTPPLDRPGRTWSQHDDGALIEHSMAPADAGIDVAVRAVPLPDDAGALGPAGALATAAASAGIAALEGAPGPAREMLVYPAALCLRHVGMAGDLTTAAALAREAIDSGAARERLGAAREGRPSDTRRT